MRNPSLFVSTTIVSCALLASGCLGKDEEAKVSKISCPAPAEGTAWVPDVPGVDEANHEDTDPTTGVDVQTSVVTASSVPMLGVLDSYNETSGPQIASLTFTLPEGLLESGSVTLVAESRNLDSRLTRGGVYAAPVLVSLNDGTSELVNVSGCASSFIDSCSGGACTWRATCGPQSPSAFPGTTLANRREKWSYQQGVLNDTGMSINTFPTCTWTSGSPTCELNSLLPAPGQLRTGAGRTYTAKYVLLTNLFHIASFSGRKTADIRLSVVRKRDGDNGATVRGAVDLNVVIVGSKNIADSHTDKGKQNLNELFKHVYSHYSANTAASPMNVRLGKINVYEWDCENGGDSYADLSLDSLRSLFSAGSAMLPAADEGKALNIFLTTTIGGTSSTILGISGGIPGAPINGTPMSGLVFASLGRLATFSPSCGGTGVCPVPLQSPSLVDMGSTISHEMGHYLGLFHLSEGNDIAAAPATEPEHDPLPDTPSCRMTASLAGGQYLLATTDSCLNATGSNAMQGMSVAAPYNSASTCRAACDAAVTAATGGSATTYSPNRVDGYCAEAVECEFNHIMWWTTKEFVSNGATHGTDGNLFSPTSVTAVNFSSFIR